MNLYAVEIISEIEIFETLIGADSEKEALERASYFWPGCSIGYVNREE